MRSDFLETDDNADVAAWTRSQVQAQPIVIIEIATAIASTGGVPAACVTRACREELMLLADATPVAVHDELERCLVGAEADLALQWLHEVGVINLILPELAATVDLAQEGGRRHKDVWEHTKLVVRQAPRRGLVRWAALLHDIGKVPTRTFTRNSVHFHGHAEVGARMFDRIARRVPFPHDDRRKVRFLIKHHLRSAQYSSSWTDSAVRRFARDMAEHLDDLLDLSRADITSRRPGRRQAVIDHIEELSQRVVRLAQEDARLPPLPTGLGTAIMTRLGIPPSRRVGELKAALASAVATGELEERREDDYYLTWLENSGLCEDE